MAKAKTKAPDQTLAENHYLARLSSEKILVRVRLSDDSEVQGFVEFFDEQFIRLTREQEPNLFLFKHDIKYLWETE